MVRSFLFTFSILIYKGDSPPAKYYSLQPVGTGGLAAARSHSRSNNTLCCYSLRSCHFVTSPVRFKLKTNYTSARHPEW